jgi:hypothetical protein
MFELFERIMVQPCAGGPNENRGGWECGGVGLSSILEPPPPLLVRLAYAGPIGRQR